MATLGRLKKGDLLLSGEINERIPVVTNGLVAHFPFDGTGNDVITSVSPTTATNINYLYEGLAIEEATTNLWSGPLAIYNNLSIPATLTQLNEKYYGQPIYRLAMTPTTQAMVDSLKVNLNNHGVSGSSITYTTSTKYATSIIWRAQKSDVVVGGESSNIPGWISGGTIDLENGWKRTFSVRDGSDATARTDTKYWSFKSPSIQLNETIYIDWTCPQIEAGKSYATSYVLGTRGNPAFHLPKSIFDFQSFTVSMRIRLNNAADVDKMYFDAYPKLYFFRTTTDHYISFSDGTQRTVSFGVNPASNEEFVVTTTRQYNSATNVVTKIYYNGVLKNTFTSTAEPSMLMNNNTGDFIKLHGWGATNWANSLVKDLSFYNRALSDDEVKKLAIGSFSIQGDGDVVGAEVVEKPLIPKNVYYFPLNSNSKDEFCALSPSSEANTVFDNGAVWVGTSVQNTSLYPDKTTGASELEFNFNSSIGLDWNSDWSIVYWKKPISTSTDTLTGYNLESLGAGSNSVGGGYAYWGKRDSADIYEAYNTSGLAAGTAMTPSALDPNTYFNNWHMISIIKSGTSFKVKFWDIGKVYPEITATMGTVASNYFVNQYGYDFKLGGYSNSNPPNNYYKDLIIAKRALTDAELDVLFKSNMKSCKNGVLKIQGSISEGNTLT